MNKSVLNFTVLPFVYSLKPDQRPPFPEKGNFPNEQEIKVRNYTLKVLAPGNNKKRLEKHV